MVWHQAVECPICHSAVCQTGPLNKLYRHINRKIPGRPWCDASLLPYKDAKKLAESRAMHICHRCGRLLTLNKAGRFPRHCRGAMMERKRGGRYIEPIRRAYCSGTKLTPELSRTWYGTSPAGCRCEQTEPTWRNPIERQFALWGQHGPLPAPEPEPAPYTVTVDGETLYVENVTAQAVDVAVVWEGSVEQEAEDLRRALAVVEKDIADLRETADRLVQMIEDRERRSE